LGFSVRAIALIGPPTQQPAYVVSLRRAADHEDSCRNNLPAVSQE
jgi:hypothetical protein